MGLTAEALSILVFLIPGLISSVILDSIVVRPEKSKWDTVSDALIFSLITYAIIFVWTDIWPVTLSPKEVAGQVTYSVNFNSGVMWQVLGLSLVLPIALGASITHDLHMWALRKLQITKLTARHNIWLDVFSNHGKRLVAVNLEDGRRVIGWPMHYSDNIENQSLYLKQAAWVHSGGEYERIPGHGLFIAKSDYIETIEFLRYPERKEQNKPNE
jgi:hypothetical protein